MCENEYLTMMCSSFLEKFKIIESMDIEEDDNYEIVRIFPFKFTNNNNLKFTDLHISVNSNKRYDIEFIKDDIKHCDDEDDIRHHCEDHAFKLGIYGQENLEEALKKAIVLIHTGYSCLRCEDPSDFNLKSKLCLTCLFMESELELLKDDEKFKCFICYFQFKNSQSETYCKNIHSENKICKTCVSKITKCPLCKSDN